MLKKLISRQCVTEVLSKRSHFAKPYRDIKTISMLVSPRYRLRAQQSLRFPRFLAEFGKEGEVGRGGGRGVTAAICHRQRRGALTPDREHC